jgi:hypothetical protein
MNYHLRTVSGDAQRHDVRGMFWPFRRNLYMRRHGLVSLGKMIGSALITQASVRTLYRRASIVPFGFVALFGVKLAFHGAIHSHLY